MWETGIETRIQKKPSHGEGVLHAPAVLLHALSQPHGTKLKGAFSSRWARAGSKIRLPHRESNTSTRRIVLVALPGEGRGALFREGTGG